MHGTVDRIFDQRKAKQCLEGRPLLDSILSNTEYGINSPGSTTELAHLQLLHYDAA